MGGRPVPEKILIIDDDVALVNQIGRRLRASGYEVLAAFDGISAVRQAHAGQPDLILLDIKLPAGGGAAVCRNLQSSVNTALIPIIFVTGLSRENLEEQCANEMPSEKLAGRLLSKPFTGEELLAKVKNALRAAREEAVGATGAEAPGTRESPPPSDSATLDEQILRWLQAR